MNVFGIITLVGIAFIVTYFLSPLHEAFHYIPCKLSGLSSEFSIFRVSCAGIENKSPITQFFFFISPYIFYSILFIAVYLLQKRHYWLKYFLLIPFFDIAFNFLRAPKGSDFFFLAVNTSFVYFIIATALATSIMASTIHLFFKLRMWDFGEKLGKLIV